LQTSALPLGYGANCLLGLELKWGLTVTEGSDFAAPIGRRGRYGKNVEWMEKVSDEQYRR